VLAFDYFLALGGLVPLAHVHPRQRFEIVSGRARIRVGRRLRRAEAGESVVVSQGSVLEARTSWWRHRKRRLRRA
jgi:mannose-6-phosphate isomerase-like protein (cupin superfamily)